MPCRNKFLRKKTPEVLFHYPVHSYCKQNHDDRMYQVWIFIENLWMHFLLLLHSRTFIFIFPIIIYRKYFTFLFSMWGISQWLNCIRLLQWAFNKQYNFNSIPLDLKETTHMTFYLGVGCKFQQPFCHFLLSFSILAPLFIPTCKIKKKRLICLSRISRYLCVHFRPLLRFLQG